MIALASGLRVYLACGVTDMRIDGEFTVMRFLRRRKPTLQRVPGNFLHIITESVVN